MQRKEGHPPFFGRKCCLRCLPSLAKAVPFIMIHMIKAPECAPVLGRNTPQSMCPFIKCARAVQPPVLAPEGADGGRLRWPACSTSSSSSEAADTLPSQAPQESYPAATGLTPQARLGRWLPPRLGRGCGRGGGGRGGVLLKAAGKGAARPLPHVGPRPRQRRSAPGLRQPAGPPPVTAPGSVRPPDQAGRARSGLQGGAGAARPKP